MSELLPCPFCGGEADEYEGDYGNGIYCMMCGAMVGEPIHLEYRTTKRVGIAEAIAAWNSRAERTCVPTEDSCCPYCGDDLIRCDMAIGEGGGAVELDPPIYHSYCPNCGCKVVGE